jgi:hypothetical protein
VAFEAAYGWGWLIELLQDYGFDPHLAHPNGMTTTSHGRDDNPRASSRLCMSRPRPRSLT